MTPGPGRFGGKVVVVTGAGSGIGAAAADRFVAEGARVVYADRAAGRLSRVATSASVLAGPRRRRRSRVRFGSGERHPEPRQPLPQAADPEDSS
jgi:NAD(P)-dependent dehydrogenase (short-subunit alcohol dehydrogenase family)